jgi:hypothetical protein
MHSEIRSGWLQLACLSSGHGLSVTAPPEMQNKRLIVINRDCLLEIRAAGVLQPWRARFVD